MTSDTKKPLLQRLRRIEGQVRGLQKMVEDERYCAEILTQIASVEQAPAPLARFCCGITSITASPMPSGPASGEAENMKSSSGS